MNDKKINATPKHAKSSKSFEKARLIFTILIFILVLIFVGTTFWQNGTVRNMIQSFKFKNSYQVVFLTNGKAYFGKITEITNKYIILNNPFYIQVKQQKVNTEEQDYQPEMKLVSIKDEFHKPKGYMLIEKSEVIFIEELEDTSQIIDIIKTY